MTTRVKAADPVGKALERIVSALLGEVDPKISRLDMIEEALNYASLLLKMAPPDHDALREQLDTVAIQLLADKVEREDMKLYYVKVTDEDDKHMATVVGTCDPDVAEALKVLVEEASPPKKKDPKNYTIN